MEQEASVSRRVNDSHHSLVHHTNSHPAHLIGPNSTVPRLKKKKKDFNPVQKKDVKVTNPIKGDLSAKHNPMKPIHATPLSDIHRERGLSGGPSCSSTNPRKILSLQNPHK